MMSLYRKIVNRNENSKSNEVRTRTNQLCVIITGGNLDRLTIDGTQGQVWTQGHPEESFIVLALDVPLFCLEMEWFTTCKPLQESEFGPVVI